MKRLSWSIKLQKNKGKITSVVIVCLATIWCVCEHLECRFESWSGVIVLFFFYTDHCQWFWLLEATGGKVETNCAVSVYSESGRWESAQSKFSNIQQSISAIWLASNFPQTFVIPLILLFIRLSSKHLDNYAMECCKIWCDHPLPQRTISLWFCPLTFHPASGEICQRPTFLFVCLSQYLGA